MPWSHIDTGVRIDFLRQEYQKALAGVTDIRCAPKNCPRCRACPPELLKQRWGKQAEEPVEIKIPALAMDDEATETRVRFRFRKSSAMLSLGHLDLARLVARTFRRAGIRVAMSQGFHPQPRLAFALALPLGQEGRSEYLDSRLLDAPEMNEMLRRLNKAGPDGLEFIDAVEIEVGKSLSSELAAAEYSIVRKDGERFKKDLVEQFLGLERLPWQRHHKGKLKKFDVREQVLGLENVNAWGELRLRLRVGEGLNAKPAEVMAAVFGLEAEAVEIAREQLFVDREGKLVPPM
jgi:radical SAM-linked protein